MKGLQIKHFLKCGFTVGILLSTFINVSAQEEKFNKIEEAKIEFVKQRLHLPRENWEKFLPIYNNYISERRKIIIDYKQAKKLIRDTLATKEVATINLNKLLLFKQQEIDLEKKYIKKYLTVLPPAKVGEVIISERDFLKELYKKVSSEENTSNSGALNSK